MIAMRGFISFVRNIRLFDARFYRQHAPDLGWYRFFPLVHYLRVGWQEGRNPHPLFDTNWYLRSYLHNTPQNPLVHYIRQGWQQGCDPHPLFSTSFFVRHYGHELRTGQSPLALYLARWRQVPRINALFDPKSLEAYVQLPLDTASDQGRPAPLTYYLKHPQDERWHPFPLFDLAYYQKTNPTAARDWPVLLKHYFEYGAAEGCRPNALFDPAYYRSCYLAIGDAQGDAEHKVSNPEAGASLLESFLHYAEYGMAQGHRPTALFDPQFYCTQVTDGALTGRGPMQRSSPLLHYLQHGLKQGLYPCQEAAALDRKPCISILTPVYNTEANQLWRCVHSVLVQAYPHWQLCLVDDGSRAAHIRPQLEAFARMDSRIQVEFLPANSGIAAASNVAATMAQGEYLAFLDHDDELTPDALYQVVCAINTQDAEVFYSDESLVNLESRHLDTLYKCTFNRELLYSHNHLMHFFVVRRELFAAVGGLDPACDGAQDYDLALKLAEHTQKIHHIPRILYHWRAHAGSSSIHHEQKHYADEAGRRALAASLARQRIAAAAQGTKLRFFYRAQRSLPQGGLVSVYVGEGNQAEVSPPSWLRSQLAGSWQELEWLNVVAEHNGTGDERPHLLRNRAAHTARGEYLFFVDGRLDALHPGSLPALLEYGQGPQVAMVGGWLEWPKGKHRHQGSLPDLSNSSPLYYASFLQAASVHHNRFHCAQYTWALPEQLFLIKRRLFLEAGGYDAAFHTLVFAQLDLCFRLYGQGLSFVYTPYAVASPQREEPLSDAFIQAAARDRSFLQERWRNMLLAGDPWYNRAMLTAHGITETTFLDWLAGDPDLCSVRVVNQKP